MECGSRPSTVRHAATIACPITWPPNTRCQVVFGLLPRNRFTSSCSRSRMASRSNRLLDMCFPSSFRGMRSMNPESGATHRDSGFALTRAPERLWAPCLVNLFRPAILREQEYEYVSMTAQRSIVICGGAFAGLALALALRQGLGPEIPVMVADPALATRPGRDPRATAIVAACRRLFEALGVWEEVAPNAQPILDMVVTDSELADATRPAFLTFAGDVEPDEPFAHMVENRNLIDALASRAEAAGVDLRATAVNSYEASADGIDVVLVDGSTIAASLLIAADGARSRLRERAGIATHGWEYDQSGIVVTVGHERDHHGRAEEHFLPAGPFAILPLTGKRSSLVWTETRKEAARITALTDEEFHGELEQRFGLHL